MGEFVARHMELDFEAARRLQKKYFAKYGTTLRGLMSEQQINPRDYLDFVHDIDFSVLEEDPGMAQCLHRLEGEKYIYTNGSHDYAEKILKHLGLEGIFSAVFDIEAAGYLPKPEKDGYHKMVKTYTLEPARSVMVEDMARNLIPASEMGMKTVWIPTEDEWSAEDKSEAHIDYIVPDLTAWLKTLVS